MSEINYNKKTYTYEDYLNSPEDERWEIINGNLIMQGAPSRIHQKISGQLFLKFGNYLSGKKCEVYHAPFCVRLDKSDIKSKIKNVVEPDITVICNTDGLDKRGFKGSPYLIIEIVSPSSAKTDRLYKFNKYEEAKVKEYWIVEPDQKIISVFLLQENNRYGRPEIYTDEDKIKVSIFEDLEIDLNDIFE